MYTEQAIIELGNGYLEETPERAEIFFIGDDIYEFHCLDLDEIYKYFEDKGYDCYVDEYAIETGKFELEPCKVLVITK